MERRSLDRLWRTNSIFLTRYALHSANKFLVTLSLGVAVVGQTSISLAQLGEQAQAGLDLALGRGGDQVAVQVDGKMQFYGGKAKAVEKHTRVKARAVAHALNESLTMPMLFMSWDIIMRILTASGQPWELPRWHVICKEVHIVLSDMNEGIDKFADLIRGTAEYENLFVPAKNLTTLSALNPVLIVVDTHIPHMVADQNLLERIGQVVVIDHHRRSEHFIENPLLVYIEPASSSTSELVTELMMYFSEDLVLGRMDATALYSGMLLIPRILVVQTGVRTLDAAAYLRRCGADPAIA